MDLNEVLLLPHVHVKPKGATSPGDLVLFVRTVTDALITPLLGTVIVLEERLIGIPFADSDTIWIVPDPLLAVLAMALKLLWLNSSNESAKTT